MSVQSPDAPSSTSRRTRWHLRRSVVVAIAAVMVAVAAFLLWGPIGLGNGPLTAGYGGTSGNTDLGGGPLGFIIPIHNSGHAPVVIDAVELIGRSKYPGPHLLALARVTSADCGGAWPARQGARGFRLASCGGPYSGPLIGRPIGTTHSQRGFPGAAEVAAPGSGTCWVMTAIVVHYHVGIRRYSATDPYQLAECSDRAQVNSAMSAAEGVG